MTVYLLHLSRPFGPRKVRHYLGATTLPLAERLRRHEGRDGAALLRAAKDAGITWRVSRVWTVNSRAEAFALEIKLKRRRRHRDYCLWCAGRNCRMGGENALR